MRYTAVIGMPRSGTTIVSAYLNAQLGAFIMGEPHSIERMAPVMNPNQSYHISDTQYGQLRLYQSKPVMEQIEEFAEINGVWLLGFKEAWTPRVDPIRIVESYGDKVERVIITLREPRRNYQSMLLNFSYIPALMAVTFEQHWKALYRYGITNDKAKFVILDQFRADPAGSLQRASGLDIRPEELRGLPGNGDNRARSKGGEVIPVDRMEKSAEMFPRIKRLYRIATKIAESYENPFEIKMPGG